MKPLLTFTAAIAIAATAHAASKEQIMFSRYLKYQFCMEKVYGQDFYKRLGLTSTLNRWGVSEPTLTSLAKTSEAVQKAEMACRADNAIELEPRPQ